MQQPQEISQDLIIKFFDLIKSGKNNEIEIQLRKMPDLLNAIETRSASSALHVAILHGQVEVTKLLLNRGISLDIGINPEAFAELHKKPVIKQLIEQERARRAHVKQDKHLGPESFSSLATLRHASILPDEEEAMLVAMKASMQTVVEEQVLQQVRQDLIHLLNSPDKPSTVLEMMRILDQFPQLINVTGNLGQTALHLAAQTNNFEFAKFLIDRRCNLNVQDQFNATPLHHAVDNAFPYVVGLLLDAGASIHLVDKGNNTPLQLAQMLLTKANQGKTERLSEIITLLSNQQKLELRPSLEASIAKHETVSSSSAVESTLDILTLSNNEAFKMIKNEYLRYLSEDKVPPQVNEILTKYPQLIFFQGSPSKRTLLHVAILNNDLYLVIKLLKIDVDVNARDNNGNTPLHLAVKTKNLKILCELLKFNPELDIENDEKVTALDIARIQHDQDSQLIFGSLDAAIKSKPIIYVPKIIHFIWAGGKRLLPKDSVEVISKWAKNNPSFQVWLWVDAKTSGKAGATLEEKMMQITKEYFNKFIQVTSEPIRVCYKAFCYGDPETKVAKFFIKDIGEENIASEAIRYEIEKPRPNYGASSDILRYKILVRYGGAYFDSDVEPAKSSKLIIKPIQLEQFTIFRQIINEHHIFYIEHQTQKPNAQIIDKDLLNFDLGNEARIGNDCFICTRGNPAMARIAEEVEKNYICGPMHLAQKLSRVDFNANYRQILLVTMAYGACDRRFTIFLTGPEHIKYILNKIYSLKEGRSSNEMTVAEVKIIRREVPAESALLQQRPSSDPTAEDDDLFAGMFRTKETVSSTVTQETEQVEFVSLVAPMRCQEYCLVDPLPNTLNWLKPLLNNVGTPEEALSCIKEAILFEAKYFKILRLEDAVDDFQLLLELAGQRKGRDYAIDSIIMLITQLIAQEKLQVDELQIVQLLYSDSKLSKFCEQCGLNGRTMLNQQTDMVFKLACALPVMNEILAATHVDDDFDVSILKDVIMRMHTGLGFIERALDAQLLQNSRNAQTCLDILKVYKLTIAKMSESNEEDIKNRLIFTTEHCDRIIQKALKTYEILSDKEAAMETRLKRPST